MFAGRGAGSALTNEKTEVVIQPRDLYWLSGQPWREGSSKVTVGSRCAQVHRERRPNSPDPKTRRTTPSPRLLVAMNTGGMFTRWVPCSTFEAFRTKRFGGNALDTTPARGNSGAPNLFILTEAVYSIYIFSYVLACQGLSSEPINASVRPSVPIYLRPSSQV
jgi:hypothetical protein